MGELLAGTCIELVFAKVTSWRDKEEKESVQEEVRRCLRNVGLPHDLLASLRIVCPEGNILMVVADGPKLVIDELSRLPLNEVVVRGHRPDVVRFRGAEESAFGLLHSTGLEQHSDASEE